MELQIFNNEVFGQVRTIVDDGVVLFCGFDIATALGYAAPRNAVKTHCRGALKRCIGVKTGKRADGSDAMQEVETTFVSEGDVYRLIGRSKLPAAQKFERWVFDEVLPTIRKTGGYVSNADMFVEEYFADADPTMKLMLVTSLTDVKKYRAQLETQRPMVEFAETIQKSKDNILMGELAKLMCGNGITIGAKRLFKLLRDEKILMANNVPYQVYVDDGYFHVKGGYHRMRFGEVKLNFTTLVTPRGQVWTTKKVRNVLNASVS